MRSATLGGLALILGLAARRTGVSTWARLFGGYRDDKAIREQDIKDLAKGLGDFVARTKGP